jgi:ubiquinone biosynthesis monooxygenase Coq6
MCCLLQIDGAETLPSVPSTSAPSGTIPGIRVSTLTYHSVAFLQACGAWKSMAPPHSTDFVAMQVWNWGGSCHIRWDASALGLPNMGHVAENVVVQAAALAAAREHGVEIHTGKLIEHLHLPGSNGFDISSNSSSSDKAQSPSTESASSSSSLPSPPPPGSNGLARVRLNDGSEWVARLIVGADGPQSVTRRLAQIPVNPSTYQEMGVTFTVATSEPNYTAWQRFLPTGPLALLPVRSGYSNVVWTTTPDLAQALLAMTREERTEATQRALHDQPSSSATAHHTTSSPANGLGLLAQEASRVLSDIGQLQYGAQRLSRAFAIPPRVVAHVGEEAKAFPLRRAHAERYVGPGGRLALVGDAAHSIHPLAGQGLNLGLQDAEALAGAIGRATEEGADFGDAQWLREKYERPAWRSNQLMITSLDAIRSLFQIQAGGVSAMRDVGMQVLNISEPIKNAIMAYAMGVKGSNGSTVVREGTKEWGADRRADGG